MTTGVAVGDEVGAGVGAWALAVPAIIVINSVKQKIFIGFAILSYYYFKTWDVNTMAQRNYEGKSLTGANVCTFSGLSFSPTKTINPFLSFVMIGHLKLQ